VWYDSEELVDLYEQLKKEKKKGKHQWKNCQTNVI
jgi:hypothetical protein